MEPESIAAKLWPGRAVELERLGGITNRNFKVVVRGEAFVLRIGGKDTELLGIDRGNEYEASRAAAALGVGPEVVRFLADQGCLVTRFIDGSRVEAGGQLPRVAETLRRVHGGPPIPGRFDAWAVTRDYRRIVLERGGTIPDSYREASALATRLGELRGPQQLVPCHNDLLNANLLDDGETIRIVDWEYAGMGDPFFDLANFAVNHELDPEQEAELLVAYFGVCDERALIALRIMRYMSDFREAMWGVVQTAASELDFDFAAYADQHFERLRRTAADPAFPA